MRNGASGLLATSPSAIVFRRPALGRRAAILVSATNVAKRPKAGLRGASHLSPLLAPPHYWPCWPHASSARVGSLAESRRPTYRPEMDRSVPKIGIVSLGCPKALVQSVTTVPRSVAPAAIDLEGILDG